MSPDGADRAQPISGLNSNEERSAAGTPTVAGERLLAQLRRIGSVDKAAAMDLAALPGDVRSVGRGHDLDRCFASAADGVALLINGLLHAYCSRADGSIQIHEFVLPGEAVRLDAPVVAAPYSVCASVDSRVAVIPVGALRRVVEDHPTLVWLFWRSAAIDSAKAREWLMRNSLLGARARMAHLFCEIFTRMQTMGQAGPGDCAFPATQELLARALGMTSVHVNRTLQVLRDQGLADLRGGRLVVPDFAALARLGGFDPRYLDPEAATTR